MMTVKEQDRKTYCRLRCLIDWRSDFRVVFLLLGFFYGPKVLLGSWEDRDWGLKEKQQKLF